MRYQDWIENEARKARSEKFQAGIDATMHLTADECATIVECQKDLSKTEGKQMARFSFTTNMPADIDPGEYEIVVDFVATPAEPMTHEYPGSPATVEIDRVYMDGNEMLIQEQLMPYLESRAWDYLEEMGENDA